MRSADLEFYIDSDGDPCWRALRDGNSTITLPDGKVYTDSLITGHFYSWGSSLKGEFKLDTPTQIVTITNGDEGWENFKVTDKAAAVEDEPKSSAAALEAEQCKQAAHQAKEKQQAERQEKKREVSAPQGVSVDFLVNRFDRILQKQFGAQYNEHTTFADLAVMLWGPANARFSEVVDLLGHASRWDESRGASGVSLCKAIGERCVADVGIANLFISWTWRYTVKKFLEALRNYCADKGMSLTSTFAWVCFLCNNQFDWLSGSTNDGVETFGENVKQIGKVVCLVDSFKGSTALYFSRLWTVFEVFVACTCGVEIDFALMSDSEQELLGVSIGELKANIKVDVMNASASDENDEKKIKALIAAADGGAHAINTKVAKLFIAMVARFLADD